MHQLSADIDTAINSALDRAGSSKLPMDDVDEQCNSLRKRMKLDEEKLTQRMQRYKNLSRNLVMRMLQ